MAVNVSSGGFPGEEIYEEEIDGLKKKKYMRRLIGERGARIDPPQKSH